MQFKVLLITSLFTIFLGCAPAVTKQSPSIDVPTFSDSSSAIDDSSSGNSDSYPDITDSLDLGGDTPLDQKISRAEYFCAEQKYKQADSLLREALSIIDSANEADSEWIPVDEYLEVIVKMYTYMMPPEYLPDGLAILQFKRQMMRALDSVNCTSEDSILINKLISRKNISFDIPMVWNDRVRRALNYYLKSKPETISRWLQRAEVYLPRMKQMFADSGLPQDLAYLPLIESGFNPLAYSRAHASGIWQFIASTGKLYGLRQNYWLDERRDPIKSTESAIRYLKKLHGDFGNWHLALAAYNCGEGGLSRAMTRSGSTDYWQLPLPAETKNYVPCYLAALTIAKNPDLFNYSYNPADTFSYDTASISDCVDMRDLANGINIDQETFRKMNPQILHWCTPPDVSNVSIYVPVGSAQIFRDYVAQIPDDKKVKWYAYKVRRGERIESIARRFKVSTSSIREINHMKARSRIIAGHMLMIPIPSTIDSAQIAAFTAYTDVEETTESNNKKIKTRNNDNSKKIHYKVKKGDTISEIAELFDVSIDDLNEWNHLHKSRIWKNQILTIYREDNDDSQKSVAHQTSQDNYRVKEGDTPYSIAKKFDLSMDELISLNDLDSKNPVIRIDELLKVGKATSRKQDSKSRTTMSNNYLKYVVSPGDNLFRISQNFSITLSELLDANDLTEQSTIRVGDVLHIPAKGSQLSKGQSIRNIVYYKVREGDTLWNIAENFGISVQSLYKINHLNSDSVLMPGDTIKVVKASGM